MQRGKEEIMRLLDAVMQEVEFDSFNLSITQQSRAGIEIMKMKDFFETLYQK